MFEEFLGPRAAAVVNSIPDRVERDRASQAVACCAEALAVVDGLDLAPHELADLGTSDLSTWNSLASEVRNLLVAVRGASEKLKTLYPATRSKRNKETESGDIDDAFDAMEGGNHTPNPIRDRREEDIEEILSMLGADLGEEVAQAVSSLAEMLNSDFIAFGQRLRNPRITADRWHLLGELQELKAKCAQCLEAVVAAILRAYTREDLADVLPRYLNQAARAVRLRTGIVDLAYDVDEINAVLQMSHEEQASTLRLALSQRLNDFANQPAYGLLRAADKREIILFRIKLNRWVEQGSELRGFKQEVEGFSKFLEVLRSINQREVLALHDRGRLQTLWMLLESEAAIDDTLPHLEAVYGRSESLDVLIRRARRGEPVAPDALLAPVREALNRTRGGFF